MPFFLCDAVLHVQITKNETIKYSLGMMLAFATAGLGAGASTPCCGTACLVTPSLDLHHKWPVALAVLSSAAHIS